MSEMSQKSRSKKKTNLASPVDSSQIEAPQSGGPSFRKIGYYGVAGTEEISEWSVAGKGEEKSVQESDETDNKKYKTTEIEKASGGEWIAVSLYSKSTSNDGRCFWVVKVVIGLDVVWREIETP
jgi:hypothetical protein